MNVLDKRESDTLIDKLQNVHLTMKIFRFPQSIVMWCNKLFLSTALLNWHKNCVGVCVGISVGGAWVEVASTLKA